MDIVKHINQHTETLQNRLTTASPEQRQNLKVATLGFYFLLPDFEEIISKYIKVDIDKTQLASDISIGNIKNHQKASEKSNAEIDVYADNYEEPEQIEIIILEAFENAVSDIENTGGLLGLFIGIIDTLDYYENFSDEPEYWNELLEKELAFQNKIMNMLKTQELFGTSIYQKRYAKVEFSKL